MKSEIQLNQMNMRSNPSVYSHIRDKGDIPVLFDKIIKPTREEKRFKSPSIPYTPFKLIDLMFVDIGVLSYPKETRICVFFTMEMAIYLVWLGFTNVYLVTDEFDEIMAKHEDRFGYKYMVIKDIKEKEFDIVVGNPPYSTLDGKGDRSSATPIFDGFVYKAKELAPNGIVSLIIPSRWMTAGKGLDGFRTTMINDTRIKLIRDFLDSSKIFPDTEIGGGVCYFIWEGQYDGPCDFNGNACYLNEFEVVVRDHNMLSILRKTAGNTCLDKSVMSLNAFGLRTNFASWSKNSITALPCLARGGRLHKVARKVINDKGGILSKWKVVIPKADGSTFNAKDGQVKSIKSVYILGPDEVCTETYLVLKTFKSKKDALNFSEYVKSKLFRLLLGVCVKTQDVSKDKFKYVPDLLDYSFVRTDKDLYKHFKLTREEVKYIKTSVSIQGE